MFIASLLTSCSSDNQKTTDFLKKTADWLEKTADALEKSVQTLEAKQTKLAAPSITPKPLKTPTPLRTLETPTPSRTATTELSPTPNHDQLNLKMVREKRSGDSIALENALISYVVKVSRPFMTDAVYGVLAIKDGGEEKGVAVIENFDCGLNFLNQYDLLGKPLGSDTSPAISGVWKPNTRFDEVSGKIYIEASVGAVAMITGNNYQLNETDQKVNCPKNSALSGAGDLPQKLAKETGKLIKNLIDGFQEGYFEDISN